MALRLGTGGLKYPLPSMYQIGAQQSAAAASSGGSASSSAYGANRSFAANKMRVQADLANAAADRNYRAQAQLQEQGFRDYLGGQQRQHELDLQTASQEFRAGEAQLDRDLTLERDLSEQDFRSGEAQKNRDFTTARDEAQFGRDQEAFERSVDAEIEAGIRSGKLELSPKQQQSLREMDDVSPKDTGLLSPEQRADFEAQREVRRREILRGARAPQAPTAQQRAEKGLVHWNPQASGYSDRAIPGVTIAGTVNENGQFQPIVDTSQQDQKRKEAEEKQAADIYKDAQDIMGEPGPDGKMRSFESAYEEALKRRRLAGLPAPEQAPDAPIEAPAGMGESVAARSGDVPTATTQAPPGGHYQKPDALYYPNATGKPMTLAPPAPAPTAPPAPAAPAWQGPQLPGQIPRPASAADRDSLQPGQIYMTPNGEMRRRK